MASNVEFRFIRNFLILNRKLFPSYRLKDQSRKSMSTQATKKIFCNGPLTNGISASSWLKPQLAATYEQWSNYSTLPKLPVPPLRQTLQRFLAVAKPLTTSQKEFEEVVKLVEEFGRPNGAGERLQNLLELRADRLSNWLSDWWLQKAYLEPRCPLPINVSPGMSMPLQNYSGVEGQIAFASKLIVGVLQFKELIEKRALPIDGSASQPFDMSQYDFLFGTIRIPGEQLDTLRYGCNEVVKPKHIAVVRNNMFFHVQVIASNGERLSERQVSEQLKYVIAESEKRLPVSDAIGLMTTEDRNVWGKMHSCMKGNNPSNAESFERIETALFLVCLDQPFEVSDSKLSAVGRQLLHGGGSTVNTGNRWFDKCLQFVVGYDGGCGLTYEHSPAEGPPVAALLDYSIDYTSKGDGVGTDASGKFEQPVELGFVLSEVDRNRIREAAQKIDRSINDTELCILPFEHFGKNLPKSHKISPDSFVQLGLQLTFFKLHKECPATYETGTLRRFKLGRTDTIRLPTVESAQFVYNMLDRAASTQTKAEALRKAVQSHKDYTAAACSGNGIDRHLLGLKLTALESGEELPGLLKSEIYEKTLHFKLSTSQVTSKHDACMMFGPMYSDCYGVCYNPQEKKILISVSAFNSFPDTNAKKFARLLSESFLEMRDVLIGSSENVTKSKL